MYATESYAIISTMKATPTQKDYRAENVTNKTIETRAIYTGGITMFAAFIVSLRMFSGETVPLFGRMSVGVMASILVAFATVIIFFIAAQRERNALQLSTLSMYRKVHVVLTTAALALVHAVVAFLVFSAGFYLAQDGFKELTLDSITASVITAVAVALGGYVMYLASATITTVRVSGMLAFFLVSGALTSMITSENPLWWEAHFSALGASDSFSSAAFNLTLIIAGIVIVSLADYIANDYAKLKNRGTKYLNDKANVIRTALILIGVFLACVGLFIYDVYPTIHNSSAGGMAFVFGGLVLGLPWLVPSFSKAFFVLSYSLMATILVCFWLMNGIGYLNLTAFELICAGVIFGWLVIFVRQIAADLEDSEYNEIHPVRAVKAK